MENITFALILIVVLPASLVLVGMVLVIRHFILNEQKLKLLEIKKDSSKDILPLRLQAYERMILFLERISPNSLLLRAQQPGMTARELQRDLHATIRSEFEHNISQQLYVSTPAWEAVKSAKDDMVKIINISMHHVGDSAMAMGLSKTILDIIVKNETVPTQRAIDIVKNEARQLF